MNEVDSIGYWVSRRWLKGTYRFLHSDKESCDVKPYVRLETTETEDARAISK
jgi:hypothetical protein